MFLNSFTTGKYKEFLKWYISQLVAPIETLFVTSPIVFGRLHNDVIFCCKVEVIEEIATANSMNPYYS